MLRFCVWWCGTVGFCGALGTGDSSRLITYQPRTEPCELDPDLMPGARLDRNEKAVEFFLVFLAFYFAATELATLASHQQYLS